MFLGMKRSAGAGAGATTGESAADRATTAATAINNDNQKLYLRVVPGAFGQQDRQGQTPIN
jgi:hypothetical protein